ncbi:MAG TPA: response regulator transcription factor [Candidatus Lustribacter sp.]|nr:response regulator transcription factor [Candidatus Lustribacter sp.]
MTISVYLLDDHEIVRRGLRELLERSGGIRVIGESGTAREAVRRIPALRPDVAVLDARLPDGSGIDVCRQIRGVDSSIKGLILTSYDDEEALRASVLAGASGYVLKDVRGNDLVSAIRRVAAGEHLIEAAVVERMKTSLAEDALDPRLRALTAQERRILDRVAQGMTNRQIALDMSLAEKTVKNYVTSILDKLGMERRTQAAVFAVSQRNDGRSGRRGERY